MKKYESHFVAFLDILGFKSLITQNSCDEIYPIFNELRNKSKTTLNLNGVQIKAFDDIHHTILSDSIIIFIKADIDDAFGALINVCCKLQTSLANRNNPILLRGGIAKGNLFYENDIIYGDGLTKAYLLESKLAKYPRIIFSGETLQEGVENTKYMFTEIEGMFIHDYKKDIDSIYYINYLPSLLGKTQDEVVVYCDRLKSLCEKWLNKEIDFSLREKYIWLQKKLEEAIECMSQVKMLYTQKEEKRKQLEIQQYNERFKIYSHEGEK